MLLIDGALDLTHTLAPGCFKIRDHGSAALSESLNQIGVTGGDPARAAVGW
jgi:hypothetical protein